MSKLSVRHALIALALLVGAGAVLGAVAPRAALACSDPPCRAR